MSLEKLKERVLTVTQAAQEKGCERKTIRRAVYRGDLTRFELGVPQRVLILRDKRYKEWEPDPVPFQFRSLDEIRAEESDTTENGSTEDDSTEDD
jgi:hypothetical protein